MLNDIRKTILNDAKIEGEILLHNAENEFEAEFTKIKLNGETKVALAIQEAKTLTENERRERLSWAKLEAKRILADAKEDAIRAMFDVLIEKMKSYTSTKQYADKMKTMITNAIKELGENATVHVKKGEKKLFAIPEASVKEDANIIGGAIVETKDGKLRIDLSFEELFNIQKDVIRKDIYTIMFGEEKKKNTNKI